MRSYFGIHESERILLDKSKVGPGDKCEAGIREYPSLCLEFVMNTDNIGYCLLPDSSQDWCT